MNKKSLKYGAMIVFEGNEASGKTTQAKRLVKYLRETCDIDAVYIREPGGSPLAEQLRKIILNNKIDPLGEFYLFNAVRAITANENIVPALKDNKLVIMDRFIDSTYIYQGFINGINCNHIDDINKMMLADTKLGNYYCHRILIDVDYRESMKRLANREGEANKYDKIDENFLRRVATAYRIRFDDLIEHHEDAEIIDGNGSMNDVFNILVDRVSEYLKRNRLV